MKAIIIKNAGDADVLKIEEMPKPEPAAGQILIRVEAAGMNRADVLLRKGALAEFLEKNPVIGAEVAGVVEKIGSNVSKWKVGDRVAALLSVGGYAEYVCVNENVAFTVPGNFSPLELAAIPEVFLTSFQLLKWIGRLQPAQVVLIHAGSSGVGTAAIQLAKLMGAFVIATTRQEAKTEFCRKLGCDVGLTVRDGRFSEEVLRTTQMQGADLILDCVGKSYYEENFKCLRQEGHFILYGTLGGKLEDCNLEHALDKWATLSGSTLMQRSLEYKAKLIRELLDFSAEFFQNGKLKPIVGAVFPFARVAEAHRAMEANTNIGKIILTPN